MHRLPVKAGSKTKGEIVLQRLLMAVWLMFACANNVLAAEVYYIQSDHLNTPRMITDAANTVVWRWDYGDPFGVQVPDENPSGLGVFTSNLRFPGQYFDRETNLHYNYFRDYDPQTGRYLQSDPIGLYGGSFSTYAYVGNDPVSYYDPYGLNPATAAGAGIGTLILPGPGTVAGAAVGTAIGIGIGVAIDNVIQQSKRPPGALPGDKGAEEWGRRNGIGAKGGREIFHDIKRGNRGKPGSKSVFTIF